MSSQGDGLAIRSGHGGTQAGRVERGEVLVRGTAIPYEVVRSNRRTKTVEIALVRGGVRVAAPAAFPAAEIEAIILQRGEWILKRANGALPSSPRRFEDGEKLPYLGVEATLAIRSTTWRPTNATFRDGVVRVQVPWHLHGEERAQLVRQALERWYRERATAVLRRRVARWARLLGVRATRVLVRQQLRRWGSCASDGTLRFNWRLIMADPDLIDYVVAHEVAHLRHLSHGPEFWQTLGAVMPDYKRRRARLNKLGPQLDL